MAFPSTLLSLAHASGSNFLNVLFGGSVKHTDGLNLLIDDLIAAETKVGTGASTPVANSVMIGNGTGTSAWLAGLTAPYFAAGATAKSLAQLTVSTATASFTSIPGTYKHLMILGSARSASGASLAANMTARLNNDSGSTYAWINALMSGTSWAVTNNGGSLVTSMVMVQAMPDAGAVAGEFGQFVLFFPDYANNGARKNMLAFSSIWDTGLTNPRFGVTGGHWSNAAVITQIDLAIATAANFSSSYFELIGLP